MAPKNPRAGKKHSTLKNYLLPHQGNGYHPKLFRSAAVAVLLGGIALFEGVYFLNTNIAQESTSFLAAVLPASLLALTNEDREEAGVAKLIHDPQLAQAAQLKANDMAEKGYFAHTSPEGKTPWYWLEQVGYAYTYAGENLAVNFEDSSAVEKAWMNSPTHQANIVKPQYTRVGYGVARGMYKGKETTFVVQEFATKASDASLTQEVPKQNSVEGVIQKVAATIAPAPKTPAPAAEVPVRQTPPSAPAQGGATAADPQTEVPAPVIAATAPDAAEQVVLGQQSGLEITSPNAVGEFIKKIAASPNQTSTYVLGGIAVLLTLLLSLALFWHANVRYLEVLGGGLIVIIFALGVLIYNATHTLVPAVPSGEPSAQISNV